MIRRAIAILGLTILAATRPAAAYIDAVEIIHPEFFTLPMLWTGNVSIAVLTVQRVDPQAGKFLCDATEWLKGKQEGLKFKFGLPIGELKNLQVGQKAVFFFGGDSGRDRAILFLERTWILVAPLKEEPSWWTLFRVQPEIKCVFMGAADELASAIKKLVTDGEVVVPCHKEPRAPELHQMRYFMKDKHRRRLVPASGQTVAELRKEADSVAKLIPKLKDPDPGVRGNAADALVSFGKEAVPALAEALQDSERINRWTVAEALSSIGSEARAAAPALVKALTEKYPMALETIRRALPRVDQEGRTVLPLLLEMLRDPSTRWAASEALKAVGRNFRPARSVVEHALKHPSGLQLLAALNLKDVAKGELGKSAVASLSESLKDKEPRTRAASIDILNQLGATDSMIAPLQAALRDPDPQVRRAALHALCRCKEVPVVLAAIQEKLTDPEVAAQAIDAANWLGSNAEPLVPRLSEILLKGSDGYLRFLSAVALGKICGQGKPDILASAIPALVHGLKLDLKDQYQGVALVSAEALSRLGPVAKAAAPALLEVIREKEENPYRMKVRMMAAEALALTDRAQADVAVAYLNDIVKNSPNPGHKLRAVDAIKRIQGTK
jgi:HEAT repeat protein